MTVSPGVERRLHADDDGLLADIEMAEAADQAHAVELAGLLLEAADQQHVAIVVQQFGLIRVCVGVGLGRCALRGFAMASSLNGWSWRRSWLRRAAS